MSLEMFKPNNSYTSIEWVTDMENKAKRKELKELQRGL